MNIITISIAILAIIAVMTAVVLTEHVMAKKKHKSAFELGQQDANCDTSAGCHPYITQPGKGFMFHSKEFNKNYIKGACQGQPDGVGSDADEATYTCGDDNN
jgi:hypothetical protein